MYIMQLCITFLFDPTYGTKISDSIWRDFQEVDEKLLAPTLEALGPIANISVESQVLYHTPKSSYSYWDAEQESHVFSTKDLPFFVSW